MRFRSTRALMSPLLLLFLFTALGSSFFSAVPLALSFLRAASLPAERPRVLWGGADGGLLSKMMSSPLEKPRPSVGVWGADGLWEAAGTSEAALGDVKPSRPFVPPEFCSDLFWTSSSRCRRPCRSSRCFCFCCFSRSEAEMD